MGWNTAGLLLSTPLNHPQLTQVLQDVKILRDTETLRDLGEGDRRRLNINEFRSPKTESTIQLEMLGIVVGKYGTSAYPAEWNTWS